MVPKLSNRGLEFIGLKFIITFTNHHQQSFNHSDPGMSFIFYYLTWYDNVPDRLTIGRYP